MTELPSVVVIESHDHRPLKKTRWEGDDIQFQFRPARPLPQFGMPTSPLQGLQGYMIPLEPAPDPQLLKKKEIADIIAAANAAAEAEAARLAAAAPAVVEPPPGVVKKPKALKKPQSKEEREANKEKRLLKLVGAVVVKCMSKYSSKLDNDVFKKYAKEVRLVFFLGLLVLTYDPAQLTHVIAEKEKKSTAYKEGRLDALSDEKVTKIKKFAKEYITKVLRKLDKSKSRSSASSKPSSSSSHHRDRDRDRSGHGLRSRLEPSVSVPSRSPDIHRDGEDGEDEEEVEMIMSVEQAMDLGSDSEEDGPNHDHAADDDADMDMDVQEQSSDEMENDPSPTEGVSSHVHPSASVSVTPITPPPQQLQAQTLDPRLKHRGDESGWDPDAIRVINGPDEVHM